MTSNSRPFAGLLTFALALGLLGEPAIGQSRPDYDAAARHADRALQAYKDLQYEKLDDQAREAMAAAMVHLHVCKPMHDQTALTRRQYIAVVVKGRGRQKAVAEECAQQEFWYASICQPRTVMRDDYSTYTVTESYCPERWRDWPLPPRVMTPEYDARIAEIRQLYK